MVLLYMSAVMSTYDIRIGSKIPSLRVSTCSHMLTLFAATYHNPNCASNGDLHFDPECQLTLASTYGGSSVGTTVPELAPHAPLCSPTASRLQTRPFWPAGAKRWTHLSTRSGFGPRTTGEAALGMTRTSWLWRASPTAATAHQIMSLFPTLNQAMVSRSAFIAMHVRVPSMVTAAVTGMVRFTTSGQPSLRKRGTFSTAACVPPRRTTDGDAALTTMPARISMATLLTPAMPQNTGMCHPAESSSSPSTPTTKLRILGFCSTT